MNNFEQQKKEEKKLEISQCCGAEVTKTSSTNMYPNRNLCVSCRKWCYVLSDNEKKV